MKTLPFPAAEMTLGSLIDDIRNRDEEVAMTGYP